MNLKFLLMKRISIISRKYEFYYNLIESII